ncbi:MAG: hypothetical protein IKC37_00835 [Clostridia bacterium]|nr:hypothetical protein [Clostridia bacterium]
MEKQTTAKELMDEIARLIAENFVAVYERGEEFLTMRSVGGKTFRLSIEEE